MNESAGGRKKKGEWPENVSDFGFEFDKIEGIVNDIADKMLKNKELPENQPIVMGFAFKLGEDGKPVVQEFSNWNHEKTEITETEPLVETQQLGNAFLITAELPGIKKNEVDIHIEDQAVTVSAWNADKSYFKRVQLPEEVLPGNANARFKNGILEVFLPKKKVSEKKRLVVE